MKRTPTNGPANGDGPTEAIDLTLLKPIEDLVAAGLDGDEVAANLVAAAAPRDPRHPLKRAMALAWLREHGVVHDPEGEANPRHATPPPVDRTGQPVEPAVESAPVGGRFKKDPTIKLTQKREKDAPLRGKIASRLLSQVQPKEYEWLWQDRIAYGEPVLFYGDCDQGKSMLSVSLASIITSGLAWPDSLGKAAGRGSVAFMQDEDSVEQTLRPRIDAAGGDPARIHALDCVEYDGDRYDLLSIPRHIWEMETWLSQHPDVRLLVIDPITAYLGGIDSNSDSEVRAQVLRPLSAMSRRLRVGVVMIGHVNKSGGTKATYRSMGSAALMNNPRASYLVATDPDDRDRRLVATAKYNLGPWPSGLSYRFKGPTIVWEAKTIPGLTADSVLVRERAGRIHTEENGTRGPSNAKARECLEWLDSQLDIGPILLAEINGKAAGLGYSRTTVQRVLARLQADSRVVEFRNNGVKFYRKAEQLNFGPERGSE